MLLARAALAALLAVSIAGLAGCDPSPMPGGPTDAGADAKPVPPLADAAPDARDDPPPPPDASPDGGGGLYEDICGPMPVSCEGRLCVTSIHNPGWNDCCDSYFCNCDPVSHEWGGIFCDPPPPPDAGVDASPLADSGAP